jgi:hypothetical protein
MQGDVRIDRRGRKRRSVAEKLLAAYLPKPEESQLGAPCVLVHRTRRLVIPDAADLNRSYPRDRLSTSQKLVARVCEDAGADVFGVFSAGGDKLSRTVRI